jgi:signal transduction histidine kinase
MKNEIGKICAEGLLFFGTTNRLISHELKNILAIISETLGLIDELLKLSDSGTALEPGKLGSLSESIIEEVDRANSIIRNMNAFAHSVDEFISEVDISRIIELMIGVYRLNAASKSIDIRFLDKGPCVITTSSLFLQNIIYRVIDFSLCFASSCNDIEISLDSDNNEARIVFSGINFENAYELKDREDLLARMLSARLLTDVDAGKVSIILPKTIGESPLWTLISKR